MPDTVRGFLLALSLVLAIFGASRVLEWKRWVEKEGWYLKEPAIQLSNGKTVTRKELLDLLIAERLKR